MSSNTRLTSQGKTSEVKVTLRKQDHLLILGASIVYAVLTYVLVYHQSFLGISDYGAHADFVITEWNEGDFFSFFLASTHPGWHILFNLLFSLGVSFSASIAIPTAFFNFLVSEVAFYGIHFLLKEKASIALTLILGTITLFVAAIFIPFYSPDIYAGHGSPTAWHNPTYIAVKAVGLLVTLILFSIFQKREANTRTLVLLGILLFISLLLKPSFFQFALPALCLYLVVDYYWNRDKVFVRNILLSLVPATLFVFFQFVTIFVLSTGEDDGGVALSFFGDLRASTPFFPVSLLILVAFPLFTAIVCRKDILKKNSPYLPIALMVIVAFCESVFLIETGSRATHGNFSWGFHQSVFIAWVFLLPLFYKRAFLEKGTNALVKALGTTLVALHFGTGVYYYFYLLSSDFMF